MRHTLHYPFAAVHVFVPPVFGMDGVGGWPEMILLFTPVDDHNCRWFATSKVHVSGEEAEKYWAKRREMLSKTEEFIPVLDVVKDIWSGKLLYQDVRHPLLARVQDIAVQAGQGSIADRENEFLGRSDAGIVAWRRILRRELQLIAEGKPHQVRNDPRVMEAYLGRGAAAGDYGKEERPHA